MGSGNTRKESDGDPLYQSGFQCLDGGPGGTAAIRRRCHAAVLPDRGSERGQERLPGEAQTGFLEVPTLPVTAAVVAPTGARVWLLAARPATLPAAVVPVLVGTAAAYHAHVVFNPTVFVLT